SAAFHTADRSAPAVERERIRNSLAEDPGGFAPQVLRVILAANLFDEGEFFDRLRLRAIGQAQKRVRENERYVAGVFRVAERAPFDELGALKNLPQIARFAKLGEAVHVEQSRRRRSDERRMRGRSDVGDLFEERDILRIASE